MGKKNNIIEINGKRYDAHSGAPIGHAPAQPAAARKPAKALTRHEPQHSKTLMRKAVRRPPPGTKRHLKAHSNTGAIIEQPAIAVVPKLSLSNTDNKRLKHASHVKKSRLITHFNANQPAYTAPETTFHTVFPPAPAPVAKARPAFKLKPSADAPSTTGMFDHAVQQATSHLEPAPKKAKKHRLHLGKKHAKHARA